MPGDNDKDPSRLGIGAGHGGDDEEAEVVAEVAKAPSSPTDSPYAQPPGMAKTEAAAAPKTIPKPNAVDFFFTHDLVRLDGPRRRRVGRPNAYTTPLEPAPSAFPPPIIAKTKSSSNAKNRKRKEARSHVPFPSSVMEGSDGVKGAIAPDPGSAGRREPDDPDGDDF
ncbi:hypothetical protein V8E53_008327 [Lactarius tabidus]